MSFEEDLDDIYDGGQSKSSFDYYNEEVALKPLVPTSNTLKPLVPTSNTLKPLVPTSTIIRPYDSTSNTMKSLVSTAGNILRTIPEERQIPQKQLGPAASITLSKKPASIADETKGVVIKRNSFDPVSLRSLKTPASPQPTASVLEGAIPIGGASLSSVVSGPVIPASTIASPRISVPVIGKTFVPVEELNMIPVQTDSIKLGGIGVQQPLSLLVIPTEEKVRSVMRRNPGEDDKSYEYRVSFALAAVNNLPNYGLNEAIVLANKARNTSFTGTTYSDDDVGSINTVLTVLAAQS